MRTHARGLDQDRFEVISPLPEGFDGDITSEQFDAIADLIVGACNYGRPTVVIAPIPAIPRLATRLSFFIENQKRPSVFVGALRPWLDEPRSDLFQNFVTALEVAELLGKRAIAETLICGRHWVYRANRCIIGNANSYETFASPSFEPLGELKADVDLHTDSMLPTEFPDFRTYVVPGRAKGIMALDAENLADESGGLIRMALDAGAKGLVIRAVPSGRIPRDPDFLNAIEIAVRQDIPVAIGTTPGGVTDLSRSDLGRRLLGMGVMETGDMLFDVAVEKMRWLLDGDRDRDWLAVDFAKAFRGECTPRAIYKAPHKDIRPLEL